MAIRKTKQDFVIFIALFAICITVGLFVMLGVSKLNLEGNLTNAIPVNPVVFFTVSISIIMIGITVHKKDYPKKTKTLMFSLILIYSVIMYKTTTVTLIAVDYNFPVLYILTIFACSFLALSFFFIKFPFKFSVQSPYRDYIFFVTSLMWLSPLISDASIWSRVSHMILGEMGFADTLFLFGFWAFVSSCLFIFIREFLRRKNIQV